MKSPLTPRLPQSLGVPSLSWLPQSAWRILSLPSLLPDPQCQLGTRCAQKLLASHVPSYQHLSWTGHWKRIPRVWPAERPPSAAPDASQRSLRKNVPHGPSHHREIFPRVSLQSCGDQNNARCCLRPGGMAAPKVKRSGTWAGRDTWLGHRQWDTSHMLNFSGSLLPPFQTDETRGCWGGCHEATHVKYWEQCRSWSKCSAHSHRCCGC